MDELNVRLQILQAGARGLHAPARELSLAELASADVQRLIDLMFATLAGTGVGLAAPQVGAGIRVVVIEDPPAYHALVDPPLLVAQQRVPVEPHVLVNPRLSVVDATPAEFFEGCLSVDGYRAIVPRARGVHVRALDRFGQPFERAAHGWYARILQHEIDHLDGRLYLQRMLPQTFVTATSAAHEWGKLPVPEAKHALGAP
jgi:peptide deformylase